MSEMYPDDYLLIAPFHPKRFTEMSIARTEKNSNSREVSMGTREAQQNMNLNSEVLRRTAR
jgi:hypothetical protein